MRLKKNYLQLKLKDFVPTNFEVLSSTLIINISHRLLNVQDRAAVSAMSEMSIAGCSAATQGDSYKTTIV